MMRWQLSETEKNKIRGCIQSIEYPNDDVERATALDKLMGYLEGEKQISYLVGKLYHTNLVPLLYSIINTEQESRLSQARVSLKILDDIAVTCSKKQVQFLLNPDRFKILVSRLNHDDTEIAMLTSKVVSTLLKIDDGIKELFWERHHHQVVRKAVTSVLVRMRALQPEDIGKNSDLLVYVHTLLDVLTHSTCNVRHRQELYGSGYSLSTQLLQTMLFLNTCPRSELVDDTEEKLILGVAGLVRENKLNQDDFRKEPKLGHLKSILTSFYTTATSQPSKYATELLYLFLLYGNEGAKKQVNEVVPTFALDNDLHEFMVVLLEGLEALKRHHYDVDVVVRALKVIEVGLTNSEALRDAKCYYFRNCHGAWPLLFLCLNNIDERIMYQACCLTVKLVRDNPMNQKMLLELDGIETLSEILSDYNLDIQLVGLQILDALKGNGPHARKIGDPCIVDHLLKIISQFPSVFQTIVQQNKAAGGDGIPSSVTPSLSVTTSLNPDPYDLSNVANWEKQVTIVQYALALIGDIVIHCPEVKSRLLDMSGEDGLLNLLSTSYEAINGFYSSLRDTDSTSDDTKPESKETNGGPAKKSMNSFFFRILLGVVETTCRALTNVVRHCPDAQWKFFKNGGTETIVSFVSTMINFKDDVTRGPDESRRRIDGAHQATLQDISYVGKGLAVLESGGESLEGGASCDRAGKPMYVCHISWLVNPELVASLLLLLVNNSEANRDIQSALCEPKVRLLLHYLVSHPSQVVVNSALLLISHLCFNNSSNQRFFATPYIVQRLQSLTAVSYLRLTNGTSKPAPGLALPWTSEHLHLLTPPAGSDTGSFFAFQSLAYSFICLANLLQIYPSAISVIVSARVHVHDSSVSWMKLLAQCLLLPCYPIQDAAMTLLSNIVNGCTDEECAEIVDYFIIDSLTKLIVMDRSDDDTGSACQPSGSGDREAELKWLGNKAFQLVLNMGSASTRMIITHLRALTDKLDQHPDISFKLPDINTANHKSQAAFYADYDAVDVYNTIVNYLPIVNGLTYTSESCRKACLDNGCWDIVISLACKVGLEQDVMICSMYILSNMISHCQGVTHEAYVMLLEGQTLDVLSEVVLKHPVNVDDEESATMNSDYIACICQIAIQLVLRIGSHQVGGMPSRRFLTSSPGDSHLLKLAEREARQPTTTTGHEALSFILLLAEDDHVATTYLSTASVQSLLAKCLEDPALPQTTSILIRKYLGQ